MEQNNDKFSNYFNELEYDNIITLDRFTGESFNRFKREIIPNNKIDINIKKAIKLFSLQSESMKETQVTNYIIKEIEKIKNVTYIRTKENNILVTKGEVEEGKFYPCIVSHTDTVHKIVDNKIVNVYHQEKEGEIKTVLTSPTGIGGDDLCGVYIVLEILKTFPVLKVVFTVAEEVGARGAEYIINSQDITFFDNVGYMIEPDRRGNSDLITNIFSDICSKEFINEIQPIIEKYMFKPTDGLLTDIDVLKEYVDVSAINVSSGYYLPHTKDEYIVWEDLINSLNFIKEIINILGYDRYEHKRVNQYSYRYFPYEDDFYNEECACNIVGSVDSSCDTHNPIQHTEYSYTTCPYCGDVMENRKYSYNCPVCKEVFIKNDYLW